MKHSMQHPAGTFLSLEFSFVRNSRHLIFSEREPCLQCTKLCCSGKEQENLLDKPSTDLKVQRRYVNTTISVVPLARIGEASEKHWRYVPCLKRDAYFGSHSSMHNVHYYSPNAAKPFNPLNCHLSDHYSTNQENRKPAFKIYTTLDNTVVFI